jgi:hypothetical protein
MVKKNLQDLSLQELTEISRDFSRLRSTCEEYNVSVVRFYKTLSGLQAAPSGSQEQLAPARIPLEKKTKPARRNVPKTLNKDPQKSAESVAIQTFLDYRRRIGRDSPADFQGLVSEVELDLEKAGVETGKRCPIQGFVSDVLYELAESEEFGEDKSSAARHKGMIERPLGVGDLERILKIKFTDAAFQQMVGRLEPEYVRTHYVFDEFLGVMRLKQEEELLSNPNIEGIVCFDG